MSQPLWDLLKTKTQEGEFVFLSHQGKQLVKPYIQRKINDFKEAFPQKQNFNYHDLRHSFAFNFLKKGGEMYHLKAILGHKTIQMTVDLYGNLKSCEIENPSPYSN